MHCYYPKNKIWGLFTQNHIKSFYPFLTLFTRWKVCILKYLQVLNNVIISFSMRLNVFTYWLVYKVKKRFLARYTKQIAIFSILSIFWHILPHENLVKSNLCFFYFKWNNQIFKLTDWLIYKAKKRFLNLKLKIIAISMTFNVFRHFLPPEKSCNLTYLSLTKINDVTVCWNLLYVKIHKLLFIDCMTR